LNDLTDVHRKADAMQNEDGEAEGNDTAMQ
jgi:hypothetical protein